jgi:hypothetical protein
MISSSAYSKTIAGGPAPSIREIISIRIARGNREAIHRGPPRRSAALRATGMAAERPKAHSAAGAAE